MAAHSKLHSLVRLAGVLAMVASLRAVGGAEAPKKAVPEAPKEIVIPKSVFVDDIKVGKDPFFPDSERRNPKPPEPPPGQAVPKVVKVVDPFAGLSLHGLTGTAKNRLAVIGTVARNYTFAAGEELAVKTADGQVRLRCVEIKSASVVVSIAGHPGTKELNLPEAR